MALADSDEITVDELQLAARNHGMPLEALRYPLTPVGLHYLLTHYDIPAVDTAAWRLHGARPRAGSRRRAVLRAKPLDRGRAPRRRPARLGAQRCAAAATARLSSAPRGAGLVRDGEREVARADHRPRASV